MKYAIHKAGPLLQVFGLLTFWVASILPFLFTWARLGLWVALAGVVLCLSGLLLQFRATRHLADSESFELQRPSPTIFLWELTLRRTVLAFCVALGMHVVVTSLWYATGRLGPLTLAAEQREAMRTHTQLFMPVCFGLVIGVLPGAYAFQKAVLLTVLLAAAGGALHWVAGRSGIQVDWPTWHGSMMLAFLSVLFMLPLTMLGCVVGRAALHIARRTGRPWIWS
ncbi:hypothetical protein LJR175_004725 [Variovorax sp. LjRoot175]|uniref:hypothetical protein n=1 Tax=Variovorax sp. LjRoot175 TaxID=3342276 RepID=UPI003ED0DD95